MRIPLVDLALQYREIADEVKAGLEAVMESGAFILGPAVAEFEAEFARASGVKHCMGVGSGTDALRFALIAAGIGNGDTVVTVPNTFIATTEAISQAGAQVAFVDIDERTYNMDPAKLENYLKSHPPVKAVIPVHLYGQMCDMDAILDLAQKHNFLVVEDACQAHGAEYEGQRTGSLGDVGCFSFYFTKNLGAYGEGGIITTSNPDIAQRCRLIRDHGQDTKYYHSMMGLNCRLDEIQAAVLKVKLPHLDNWIDKRRSLAEFYNSNLPPSIMKPEEMSWAKHVYYVYVIRTPDRDRLRDWLDTKGISTGIHYPIPVHRQQAWRAYGGDNISLPITEKITGEILSLPMYPELKEEEIGNISECIRQFYESK